MPRHIWLYLLPRLFLSPFLFSPPTSSCSLQFHVANSYSSFWDLAQTAPSSVQPTLPGECATFFFASMAAELHTPMTGRAEQVRMACASHVCHGFWGPIYQGRDAFLIHLCVLKVHPAQDGFSRNVCSGNKHLLVYEKCHICKLSAPQSASVTLLGDFP